MGVSKVVYGNDTLVDLTGDTVTPTSLTLGATAHAANGERIVGEYQYVLPPMSDTTRGGARIQPDSGLEITDTDNLRVRLALESDGTVRGGIAELKAKGHAEQVQTTGKNLLGVNFTSTESNGVTLRKNGDGSLTINGTASSYVFINLNYQANTLTIPAGDYVINGGLSTFTFRVYSDSNRILDESAVTDKSFTIPSNATNSYVRIDINAGTSFNNETFWPMVRLASVANATFEPYTGGAPSPSPEFPQAIEVVRGRNLLPNNATSQTINGVTFTVNADGSVTVNGTATSNAALTTVENLSLDAGSYYLSGCPSGGNQTNKYAINLHRTSPSIVNDYEEGNGKILDFSGEIICNITIIIRSGVTASNLTFYPQLVKGSTPQPYVPYGYVGLDVTGGKNLLDAAHPSVTGAATVTFVDDVLTVTADRANSWSYAAFDIQCDEGAGYVISFEAVSSVGYVVRQYFDATSTIIGSSAEVTSGTAFTTPSGCVRVRLVFYSRRTSSGAVGDSASYRAVMLERGDHATSYEPYANYSIPIPLPQRGWVAGLPDGTADSLRLDGAGKCEWELKDEETTTAATDGVTGTIGVDVLSTTGQIADGVTVLYKLATPVIEDCGYVEDWPTDLPEGCVVSCPELDAVGVKYFIDSAVTELARQWYARAYAELGDAVTELAGRVAALES